MPIITRVLPQRCAECGRAPGGTLTYVLNFTYPTGRAVNARLSLPLPPGTDLVSATDALVWDLGSLAAGAIGQ